MYVLRRRTRIEIWTPAKLNLFLEVLERRDDGFHEIETLMVPVSLFDSLRFMVTADARIEIACRWSRAEDRPGELGDLPVGTDNLAYRAVALLQRRSGVASGLRGVLTKRIPSASGLGGGSSDAAAALLGAHLLWGLNWSWSRLMSLASELGSDVPFFFNGGAAICRGRGERVQPVPTGAPQHFVVVRPPVGLSTAAVYQQTRVPKIPRRVEHAGELLRAGSSGPLSAGLWNRLQEAALQGSEEVARVQHEFRRMDVLGHQLSGSGSGYFGVCRNAQHAQRVARLLQARRLGRVFRVMSVNAARQVRQYASLT